MRTATDLGPVNKQARGDQRLYRVDPPMTNYNGDDFAYVVVSAVNATYSGPETYIFGANETGDIIDWGELDGSFRGDLDHEEALRNAGYEVVQS